MKIEDKSVDSVLLLATPEDWSMVTKVMKPGAHLLLFSNAKNHHTGAIAAEDNGLEIRDTIAYVFSDSENGGSNVAMKLVVMARKPLQGTVAENTLRWGSGGINVDRCRIGVDALDPNHRVPCSGNSGANSIFGVGGHDGNLKPEGRWPANLILQDCPTVRAMFPQVGAAGNTKATGGITAGGSMFGIGSCGIRNPKIPGDRGGSAARFFYAAPSIDNLVAYLLKLITPPNGTVFTNCGTGNLPKEYKYVTDCKY